MIIIYPITFYLISHQLSVLDPFPPSTVAALTLREER